MRASAAVHIIEGALTAATGFGKEVCALRSEVRRNAILGPAGLLRHSNSFDVRCCSLLQLVYALLDSKELRR